MLKSEYEEIKANLIKKSLEKDKQELIIPIERRKGNDFRIKFVKIMSFIVWIAVFIVVSIMEKASREIRTISKGDFSWLVSKLWETNLVYIALIIAVMCIISSIICIILDSTRHRRRSDKIKKSLIICEILCLGLAFFLSLKLC